MGVKWTEEQRQAIRLRGGDILVSAAAGSGKTAVLVERILSLVTDPEDPADIDRLLVVTFTRAAAAEMRGRIGRALEERLAADPDNEHLQRQSVLLHHAQISTIDSFCTQVIGNYFHRIDLDPGYRVASESELGMLKAEVAKDLLEEEFGRAGTDFLALAESIAPGKNDARLEEIIRKVADYAESDPDPEGWLAGSLRMLEAETPEMLEAADWIRGIVEETRQLLADMAEETDALTARAKGPGGPAGYLPALAADRTLLESLASCGTYRAFFAAFAEAEFVKLGGKRGAEEDPELRDRIRKERNALKDAVKKIKERYFAASPEEVLAQLAVMRPQMEELIRLVRAFRERFREKKKEKNMLDFSDLEHYSLEILLEETPQGSRPTEAARELGRRYREIMIDEYQDSNLLQEVILGAVAEAGGCRRFMVGDMKQSIYGFRMARPDLFLDKYERFAGNGAPGRRIDLHKNFRSRNEVLDITNAAFRRLMTGSLGGIRYDDSAALYPGAEIPACPVPGFAQPELLIISESVPEFASAGEKAALEQTEALAVACRIRGLLRSGKIFDNKNNEFRAVEYRDCVVLMRSVSDDFVHALQEAGIPAHADSREGFYSSLEVAAVLNYLRIIDNPLQDIPFLAVLRSPIGGLTDLELALLRSRYPDLPVPAAAKSFADLYGDDRAGKTGTEGPAVRSSADLYGDGDEEDFARHLAGKLRRFLAQLAAFRADAPFTPAHELIRRVLLETGFYSYASAMPAGEQREANLRMLVERAVEYEQTSYHGLFNFVRYVENMGKNRIDQGEVNRFGEGGDSVRVMTIHKSKGLEFPIVFVSGLGKQFNDTDARATVSAHAKLGLCMDIVDPERRIRQTPLARAVLQQAIRRDNLAEELRVLYVAMTRASEKLILTGCRPEFEKSLGGKTLSLRELTGAKGYLDWLLPAIGEDAPIRVEKVDPETLVQAEGTETLRRQSFGDWLASSADAGDAEAAKLLARQADFRYPYEYLARMPAKMTVTELKRASLAALAEEAGEPLYEEKPVIPYLPRFLQETEEEMTGAARGTAYHRVWECIDHTSGAPVEEQLAAMVRDGKLRQEEADAVDPADIRRFLSSPLGERMREAAGRGALRREQPFVFLIPADEADSRLPAGEEILVQGIIDAFFEEDGGYILVDYKTDRVHTRDGRDLAEKYAVQLQTYARALEQITGRSVTEKYIYSMALGKEIRI